MFEFMTNRKRHYWEVWPCSSRCGLIGGIVSVGVDFEDWNPPATPSVAHSLLMLPDLDSLLQYHVYLHAAMLLIMIIMDFTSETVVQPQLRGFLYKNCHGHCVSLQHYKPNTSQQRYNVEILMVERITEKLLDWMYKACVGSNKMVICVKIWNIISFIFILEIWICRR